MTLSRWIWLVVFAFAALMLAGPVGSILGSLR